MNTLAKRLAWARLEKKMSQQELAKQAGVAQSTIGSLESGARLSARKITAIAEVLGVNAAWLADGKGIPGPVMQAHRDSAVESEQQLPQGRYVAIIGIGQGGPDGYISINDYAPGDGDGYIYTYSRDPGAYGVRVRGDSMRPRIKSGEFLVVEPTCQAQPGDDVVVKLKDDKALVKEMLWVREDEVSFGSINNGIPPITIQLADIRSIHRVAAIVPRGSALLKARD